MYSGLRRGELRALRWSDVDLERRVIRVDRSWDQVEGPIDPKSRAGRRPVPIARVLMDELAKLPGRRAPKALVFGRTADKPFGPSTISARADTAWEAAGLKRITLHECRHTFAS
jgi:integrase